LTRATYAFAFAGRQVYIVHVIEKFIQHAPADLPGTCTKHLNQIERKSLKKYVCDKSSSFHAMLAKARPPPAAAGAATTPMEVSAAATPLLVPPPRWR
jgi:hypothetical protein